MALHIYETDGMILFHHNSVFEPEAIADIQERIARPDQMFVEYMACEDLLDVVHAMRQPMPARTVARRLVLTRPLLHIDEESNLVMQPLCWQEDSNG